MRERVAELEALCGDVYKAAVVLGLPQALIDRMWIAAGGNRPQGYAIDLSTLEAQPAPPPARPVDPIVDIPLVHGLTERQTQLPWLPDLPQRSTVLIVEDDPAMLDLIVMILRHENYELHCANSGDAALEKIRQHNLEPDLLLTDLMMPGLTGRELAARMRVTNPGLRVLYETGFTDELFRSRTELESNAAFLEKPFSARGLIEAARLALFDTLRPAA